MLISLLEDTFSLENKNCTQHHKSPIPSYSKKLSTSTTSLPQVIFKHIAHTDSYPLYSIFWGVSIPTRQYMVSMSCALQILQKNATKCGFTTQNISSINVLQATEIIVVSLQ